MSEKYNGYTNYETWLMAVNLSNSDGWFNNATDVKDELTKYELVEFFKDDIMAITEREIEGHYVYIIEDLFSSRDINEIDWYQLTEMLILEE